MKVARLVLCAALVSTTATAQGVTSFGTPDCGKWVNAPNLSMKGWLIGFLTGANHMYATLSFDPLDQLSSVDQAFVWMDNYCKSNPLSNVGKGAIDLYDELKRMARKK